VFGLPQILQAQILSRFHHAIGLRLMQTQAVTDNMHNNAYSCFKLDMMRIWEHRINYCKTVMDHIL